MKPGLLPFLKNQIKRMLFLLLGCYGIQLSYGIEIERFEHLDTRAGLSQNNVLSMYCDHQGFMWFGTYDGLNRFDGYNFKIFKSEEGKKNALTHNRISGIWEDSLDNLWIKTYEGYYHYLIPETEEFITFPYYYKSLEEKNSAINCFFQPVKDEVWLGSSNSGAYFLKYDSLLRRYRTTQFLSRGPSSISNNTINFIISDNENNIFLGTNRGLSFLSRSELSRETPYFNHLYASYQFTGSDGFGSAIYFGTRNNGILVYDLKEKKFRNTPPGLEIFKNVEIKSIRRAVKSGLLIVTTRGQGLFLYHPGTDKSRKFDRYGTDIISVFEDSYGMVWMKTERFGIVRINPFNGEAKHYTLTPKEIQPVIDDERPYYYEDKNNNFWIGIHGGGLASYDRTTDSFVFYRNIPNSPYTISSDFVHCIAEDKSGLLWVGTGQFNGGINKAITSNPSFRQIIPKKSLDNLADNVVRCLYRDSNGYIWMATKSGIVYIYTPEFRLFYTLEYLPLLQGNLPGYNVYTITEDRKGYIWMGSKGGGIVVSSKPLGENPEFYKNIRFHSYKHIPRDSLSLSHNFVYSIYQDSEGKVWIGTYGGGLSLVTSRTGDILNCRTINTRNSSLSGNDVRFVFEDSKKQLWVATTFGLNLLQDIHAGEDTLKFRTFFYDPQDERTISYNDIVHIFEDTENRLWFATLGGGASLLSHIDQNGAAFKHFRKKDGLINDAVFAILEDKNNNIWFSTEKGISKLDVLTGTFENYDRNSGLFSENFSENTCCMTTGGKLVFGSINGTLVIDPDQINKTKYKPPVIITNFQLFNRTVDFADPDAPIRQSIETLDTILLRYNQHSFSFEYAALSYFAPDQNRYEFILENFDEDWNEVGNQRKATYTNLLPGEYTFKVRAASWDGTWNLEPRSIYIRIIPPWYKSKMAIIAYIILIIAITYISWRIFLNYYRLQNNLKVERRVNDIKLQFFTNISHEIRTPLTLILGPIEDIKTFKNLPRVLLERIEIMERNGKRMLRLVNQLLDFRKIQKEKMKLKIREVDLVSFVRDIYMHFIPIAKHKNIDFKFITQEERLKVFVDPNKFDSVVFNILSNAFKYTKDNKTITIEISKADDQTAEVTVTDQGMGIPPEILDVLFQRFTSLSNTSSSLEGTGIGLNLSYEIMKLHKGDIKVRSEINKGSSFKIQITLGRDHFEEEEIISTPEEEAVQHDADIDMENLKDDALRPKETLANNVPKLLIVEDNPEIIIYLNKILSGYFDLKAVVNGKEGLKAINGFHPDLIISDIMMPVMDGIEMTKRIKSNIETSHIPVVMLTAKSTIEDQIIGIDSGAEAYLLKPFNAEYLLAIIRNIIRQREIVIKKYRDKKQVGPDEIKITPKDDEFLKNIVGIIETNYSNPEFNVEKLVDHSTFSRTVMYNKIKGLTGLTPVDFIRQMRLQYAAGILRESDRNVSETAYLTGFNDVKYFSKCFKEMFGISPREYRKDV
jgi:signal transduction histidine kinase/ligand-binding sensor domain-containing protein/DNA-binding response OmpR family regulator